MIARRNVRTTYRLAALAAGLAVASLSPSTDACMCAQPPPPSQAQTEADAVFEGRVVAITQGVFNVGGGGSTPGRAVQMQVLRAWKGARAGETTTVHTGMGDADCGYAFAHASSYLVYARMASDGAWWTNLCTRTRESSDAAEDFEALGPPSNITAPPGGPAAPPTSSGANGSGSAAPSLVGGSTGSKAGCAGCRVGAPATGDENWAAALCAAALAGVVVRRRRGATARRTGRDS